MHDRWPIESRSSLTRVGYWFEDRDAGSLLREVSVLEREDSDYELDGREMIGQDWVVDDEEEYDESFVPPGGLPDRAVAEIIAPAKIRTIRTSQLSSRVRG